jgi:hypothetical protein
MAVLGKIKAAMSKQGLSISHQLIEFNWQQPFFDLRQKQLLVFHFRLLGHRIQLI